MRGMEIAIASRRIRNQVFRSKFQNICLYEKSESPSHFSLTLLMHSGLISSIANLSFGQWFALIPFSHKY